MGLPPRAYVGCSPKGTENARRDAGIGKSVRTRHLNYGSNKKTHRGRASVPGKKSSVVREDYAECCRSRRLSGGVKARGGLDKKSREHSRIARGNQGAQSLVSLMKEKKTLLHIRLPQGRKGGRTPTEPPGDCRKAGRRGGKRPGDGIHWP